MNLNSIQQQKTKQTNNLILTMVILHHTNFSPFLLEHVLMMHASSEHVIFKLDYSACFSCCKNSDEPTSKFEKKTLKSLDSKKTRKILNNHLELL